MTKNILVFIPNTFTTNKSGFIEGFHKNYPDLEAYYITNDKILPQCKNYIGYTGRFLTNEFFQSNSIFIEYGTQTIHINSKGDEEQYITKIFYDFKAFTNSDVINMNEENYGIHIEALTQKLHRKNTNGSKGRILNISLVYMTLLVDFFLKILSKLYPIAKNCATFTHLENSTKTAKWFLRILDQERNFSPKLGNIIFAKIIDLILGIILIYTCLEYEDMILTNFKNISQEFVTQLRQLLIYLMGSPIGLKLNHAFNHSLGRFFFYHITLWRVFLQAMQPLLGSYFRILLVPAVLGVSYQIAIFCDIISLATFHIYCIYVYAARLFSLQIKGLISLWRLFIGRKFNPLRSRVDSCEYSSNQLFIGTLGFTILLFLLPTTTMYYTVFATFRLVILATYNFLAKIKDLISSIPLYIIILWIFQSPTIAGTLQICWKPSTDRATKIEVTLTRLSLIGSIKKISANSMQVIRDEKSLGRIIHYLFTGQLV